MADNENSDFRQFVPFKKYIHEGKWDDAKQFIRVNSEAKRAKISYRGSTALHIAIFSGHTNIVEELVKIMTKEDLEIKDDDDVTVLGSCAIAGNVKMAECIIKQNQDLLNIENSSAKLIPVVLAITDNSNAIEMVRYLYKKTPPEYLDPTNGVNGATFVTRCIFAKAFGKSLRFDYTYVVIYILQNLGYNFISINRFCLVLNRFGFGFAQTSPCFGYC